jgi:Zn-finger nucleic acid-binding protein
VNCPKCRGSLQAVLLAEIEIDRCSVCNGLFFDMLEDQDLLDTSAARKVDVGDPAVGRERDLTVEIACPRDGALMIHMADPQQQHIEFESCPHCFGRFFDAGEINDLAHSTILDWFRTGRARRGRLHPGR